MPWQCREILHDIVGLKPAKELATPVTKFAPVSHRGCACGPQAPVFLRRLPRHAYIVGAFLLL